MWKQLKHAMVESIREVYASVRVQGKNLKNVLWKDKIKAAVRRKEVLPTSNEETKERCMEAYRGIEERRERLKGVYTKAKRK